MSDSIRLFSIFLILVSAVHLSAAVLDSMETNDDAFISFRYAENLAAGKGLVFNPGERVEGYTNFLWIILIALARPFQEPVLISKILGVACSVLLIISFAWFFFRIHPLLCIPPVLYLALDPGLIAWSTRGLETSLFILCTWLAYQTAVTASVNGMNRTAAYAGLMAALAVLTRPEGILTAMFFPMLLFPNHRRQTVAKQTGWFSVVFLTVLLPYMIWKLLYYGTLIPNTFYAKTGGGFPVIWRGLAYIIQGWNWPEIVLLILVITGCFHPERSGWMRRAHRTNALFIFLFLVYILAVGGDSLGPDRFLTPLLPFMTAGAFLTLSSFKTSKSILTHHILTGTAVLFLIIGNAIPLASKLEEPDVFSPEKERRHHGTRTGLCLAKNAKPDQSIATSVIGRIPYYSGLYTLDVFGLIDPYIARQPVRGLSRSAAGHEKTDWEYILSRQPDFITGRELIVMPPREPEWLKSIRVALHGEPDPVTSGIPAPPYPGYSPVIFQCNGHTMRIWRKNLAEIQDLVTMQ
jgi:arabinofuranosyltransferase